MADDMKPDDDAPIMNSIGEECTELKKYYDICFNAWFKDDFLKGSTRMNKCQGLFDRYQKCIRVSLYFYHQILL